VRLADGGKSKATVRCSSFAGRGTDDIDVNPGTGKHAHQGINAKEIDSSANEIADPRLRDTEELGGFSLSELACLGELTDLDHECGAQPEVLSFTLVKAEVGEHIPADGVILTSMVKALRSWRGSLPRRSVS
jgi:hypothetical protein